MAEDWPVVDLTYSDAVDSEDERSASGSPSGSSASASADGRVADLPTELLLHTLHHLADSCSPWDRVRFLQPATLVSRRWHELARPLLFRVLRLTPSRTPKLLPVLNSTRKWGSCVRVLRLSFGLHYNPVCTPLVLGLIASCRHLQRLDLVGCGKPVHKSFVAQSQSVLYAEALAAVLAGLKELTISGGRKKGSTGLDAAKLTGFLLPLCTSLQVLVRGELSFHTVTAATLQPMLDPWASPAVANPALPAAGQHTVASLRHVKSITLACSNLSSRAMAQALAILNRHALEEIIIRAGDAPTRRYFDNMLMAFGPNLKSLKIQVMFPSHRLYHVFDQLPVWCPRLEVLHLAGPLCTDALLRAISRTFVSSSSSSSNNNNADSQDSQGSKAMPLRELALLHNRAVTPDGLHCFLSHTSASPPSTPWEQQPRQLILDDLLAPQWSPYLFRQLHQAKATLLEGTGWLVSCSDMGWHDKEGDDDAYGGQRRHVHHPGPLPWVDTTKDEPSTSAQFYSLMMDEHRNADAFVPQARFDQQERLVRLLNMLQTVPHLPDFVEPIAPSMPAGGGLFSDVLALQYQQNRLHLAEQVAEPPDHVDEADALDDDDDDDDDLDFASVRTLGDYAARLNEQGSDESDHEYDEPEEAEWELERQTGIPEVQQILAEAPHPGSSSSHTPLRLPDLLKRIGPTVSNTTGANNSFATPLGPAPLSAYAMQHMFRQQHAAEHQPEQGWVSRSLET